jgi:hypothetical protein
VRIVGICLTIETNSRNEDVPLSYCIRQREEISFFFRKEFVFFWGKFAEQEKILSTTGERCSTTGKAGRKGVLGNFKQKNEFHIFHQNEE